MPSSRRRFLSLAALGLGTTAGCAEKGPSRPQTETHRTTRSTTAKTTTNPPESGRDALSWTYETGHDIQYAPAVTEDAVFVPSNHLYALNPDGTERWVFETERRVTFTPRVGDAVYLARPKLRAIEFDGTERWTRSLDTSGTPYPLALTPETFYVGTIGHVGSSSGFTVVALDTTTGAERWRAEIGARSRVALGKRTIYVASPNRVRAFDRGSGTERWTTDLPGLTLVTFAGLAEGRFVVGGDDLVALDEADGTERWRFSDDRDYDDEAETVTGARLHGDTVYVAAYDDVSALRAADGSKKWSAGPVGDDVAVFTADDDTVLVGGDGVSTLDASTGTERWNWKADASVWSSATTDGRTYSRGETWLAALDSDGTEQWYVDFDVQLSPMAVSSSGAFVGTRVLGESQSTSEERFAPGVLYAFGR